MLTDYQRRLHRALALAVRCGVSNLKRYEDTDYVGIGMACSALYGTTKVILRIIPWGDDTWIDVDYLVINHRQSVIRWVMDNETGEFNIRQCGLQRDNL